MGQFRRTPSPCWSETSICNMNTNNFIPVSSLYRKYTT